MNKPKILYVDDEFINLEMLKLTFTNDFDIITAASGSDGLEILEDQPEINVIISDLKMPQMDGLEFIKIVKSKAPQKVCLLLTGFLESDILLEGFNKEIIFRYMMKPWDREELKNIMLEALDRAPSGS